MYAKTYYYQKLFNIDYHVDVQEAKYIWITQLAALQPLPKGWASEIDPQKGIEYFYQIDGQNSQWQNPNEQFLLNVIQTLRQNASDFKKNSIEQHFNQQVPNYVIKYLALMCYYQIHEFKQNLCPQIAVFLLDERFRDKQVNIEFIHTFDEQFQTFQTNMRRKQREELQTKSTIFPYLNKGEIKYIPYDQALLFDLQTYKLTLITESRFREKEYCINVPNTHVKYYQPPKNKAQKAHHFVQMFRDVLGNPPEVTEFYCVAHYMAKFLPTYQVSKPALHIIQHAKSEDSNLNLKVHVKVNNMNGEIESTINGKPTSINFCCAAAGYRLDIGELSDHLSVKLDRLALKPGPPDFQSRLYLEEAFKKLIRAQKQIMSDLDRIGINIEYPLRNIEEGFPAMSLNEACSIIYQCFIKLQQTRKGVKLHLYVK